MVTRKVIVNGRELSISAGADGTFRVGGRSGNASIVQVEPGVYSVLMDGHSYEVRVQGGALNVEGEMFTVEVEDPRELKRGGAVSVEGKQTLRAAMPGKVVRVLVEEGAAVTAGQGIVVIEAMKMQNEVKSPKAGRVVSIPAREGAAVGAGEPLAVVE